VFKADHLAERRAAIVWLELAVDEPVGWSELLAVPGLLDHRQFDLCAISEVVMHGRVAEPLAFEAFLPAALERLES
jgi:hypothetical protein